MSEIFGFPYGVLKLAEIMILVFTPQLKVYHQRKCNFRTFIAEWLAKNAPITMHSAANVKI